MNKKDISSEKDIKILVDAFYRKVLDNEEIGFIFTEVAGFSLHVHIPVMYSFWSSVLLGTKSYQGNPMSKHLELNEKIKLEKHHFETWLLLWQTTVNEYYVGNKAEEAITRSKDIAAMMRYKLADKPMG